MEQLQTMLGQLAFWQPVKIGPLENHQLELALTEIAQFHFRPLIVWQAQQEQLIADKDFDSFCDDLFKNQYLPRLASQILARLNSEETGLPKAAEALAQYYLHNRRLRQDSFDDFRKLLLRVLIASLGFQKDDRRQRASLKRYREGVIIIARALQEVLIWMPGRFLTNNSTFSPDTIEPLQTALQQLDQIRQACQLPLPVLPADEIQSLLKRKFAQAKGSLWVPFNTLSTAPLSEADLALYARDPEYAQRLARQIVRGDGVILITGYRGVGKSTFINQALNLAQTKIEAQQAITDEHAPWKIIPVSISIAKAREVHNILCLCIRKLQSALSEPAVWALLTRDEKFYLDLAYLRATRDVNIQQTQSEGRTHESSASLDINPGDLLPAQVGGGLLKILPAFAVKANKELIEKFERTIGLPKYDADQAEEDISQLICLLARSRISAKGQRVRLKLVLVFDEMDKLDALTEQMPLVKELKNLFLTRHAVFLLVTSKEFHYQWLEARQSEDAVLSSYFSAVYNVPLFTAVETKRLLQGLVPEATKVEDDFLTLLAQYLTYRAGGLPREIVRSLQERLQWDGLQPYLTSSLAQQTEMKVYGALQQLLEQRDTADRQELADLMFDTAIWEQIQRGRYHVIEECLRRRDGLQVIPATLEMLQAAHFKNLKVDDVSVFVERLRLALVELKLDDIPDLLFEGGDPQPIIRATQVFRNLANRPAQLEDETPPPTASRRQMLVEATALLKSQQQYDIRQALKLLRLAVPTVTADLPPDLIQLLYSIFTTPGDRPFRLEASNFLNGNAMLAVATQSPPDDFIERETNESLISQFIRLGRSAQLDLQSSALFNSWLMRLLMRLLKQSTRSSSRLPIVTQIIEALADSGSSDALAEVVNALEPRQPLTGDLLRALRNLAERTNNSSLQLIGLLIDRNFTLEANAAQSLLDWRNSAGIIELWRILISQRPTGALGRETLLAILHAIPNQTLVAGIANQWLSQPEWTAYDEALLIEAIQTGGRVLNALTAEVQRSPVPIAIERLEAIQSKLERASVKVEATQETSSSDSKPVDQLDNRGWISTVSAILVGVLLVAIFLWLPVDLPESVSWPSRIMGRFLEVFYPVTALVTLGLTLMGLIFRADKDNSAYDMAIGMLWAALVCFILTGLSLAGLIWWLHHPLTVAGQVVLIMSEAFAYALIWVTKLVVDRALKVQPAKK